MLMILQMKQTPEWKESWKAANQNIEDPLNRSLSQTSWALTGNKQPRFCSAWDEASVSLGVLFLTFWLAEAARVIGSQKPSIDKTCMYLHKALLLGCQCYS